MTTENLPKSTDATSVVQIPLRPCPFCGSTELEIEEVDPEVYAVGCNSCGAMGPAVRNSKDAERAAVMSASALWNSSPYHDTKGH